MKLYSDVTVTLFILSSSICKEYSVLGNPCVVNSTLFLCSKLLLRTHVLNFTCIYVTQDCMFSWPRHPNKLTFSQNSQIWYLWKHLGLHKNLKLNSVGLNKV